MLWAGYGYGGFGGNTASNGTYAISVSFYVYASPDGSATPYNVSGSGSNVENSLGFGSVSYGSIPIVCYG